MPRVAIVRSLVVPMVLLVAAASWAPRAAACSAPAFDPRFQRTTAPPGGLWWLVVWDPLEQLTLVRTDGSGEVVVDVVARGLQASVAVRVPEDAEPGTTFLFPEGASPDFDAADPIPNLVVGEDADAPVEGDVPVPDLVVEHRETVCGYGPALALPTPCARGAGLWHEQVCDHVFANVVVPRGLVLDLFVRADDVEPLAPLTSMNEAVFDGREPGDVDVILPPPNGAERAFRVHARFRRIVDGAEGDVVTVDVERDTARPSRIACVGCSAGGASTSALSLAALAAFSAVRRRARQPAPMRAALR